MVSKGAQEDEFLETGAEQATEESSEIPTSSTNSESNIDFSSDPKVVWAVVEGERLTYGHLFNPTFATETSIIEPLPHSANSCLRVFIKTTPPAFYAS